MKRIKYLGGSIGRLVDGDRCIAVKKGSTYEVSDECADALFLDFPGCFEHLDGFTSKAPKPAPEPEPKPKPSVRKKGLRRYRDK